MLSSSPHLASLLFSNSRQVHVIDLGRTFGRVIEYPISNCHHAKMFTGLVETIGSESPSPLSKSLHENPVLMASPSSRHEPLISRLHHFRRRRHIPHNFRMW